MVRVLQVPCRCLSGLPETLPTGPETQTIHCHSFLQDRPKASHQQDNEGLFPLGACTALQDAPTCIWPVFISLDLTWLFLVYFFCCFLPLLGCFLFCPPFLSVFLCRLILKPFWATPRCDRCPPNGYLVSQASHQILWTSVFPLPHRGQKPFSLLAAANKVLAPECADTSSVEKLKRGTLQMLI